MGELCKTCNKSFDDIVSEYEFPSKDYSSQIRTVLPTDITQKEKYYTSMV